MRRLRLSLLYVVLLLAAVPARADDYFDPEAVKGIITFSGGTMTARFDTEWDTYDYYPEGTQLAQGNLGVLVYYQDTRTYEWLLCRNFWSIYAAWYDGVQPRCTHILTDAHQSETSDETRMIWTYDGPGTRPRGPSTMFAYVLWYVNGAERYEQYAGALTCTTTGAVTTCATARLPDTAPGEDPPPPTPDPRPIVQEATGWSTDSYGCGTFGC